MYFDTAKVSPFSSLILFLSNHIFNVPHKQVDVADFGISVRYK